MSLEAPCRDFYPPSSPQIAEHLGVGDGYQIWYEVYGAEDGIPALFLHGGPGGGLGSDYHRYFDLERYRLVLFDQRGCGKSTPRDSVEENTTWHLVEDIELLRQHLGVEKWVLFGGSWGSALALAYTQKYPERARYLILRGIFMLRPEELLWFYQAGAHMLHPEEWEGFLAPIPESERGDLISAYHRRLFSDKRSVQVEAARAWTRWEKVACRLLPNTDELAKAKDDEYAVTFARIECHYFMNGGFFSPRDQLLNDIGIMKDIPGVIVQGRYDLVCPVISAFEIDQRWTASDLIVLPNCGHSGLEKPMISKLVEVTDEYARSQE